MAGVWDKVKKTVSEGVSTIVETTEDLTRVSKARLNVANVKNRIKGTQTELGITVYRLIQEGKSNIEKDEEVTRLIETIKELETELKEKEEHLSAVRQEKMEKEMKEQGE